MKECKYYVYRHIRLDLNTPFYVGKGQGNRAYTFKKRNVFHARIRLKHGCLVEIIMDNLEENYAFQKEIEFIKLYKSMGYCEANLTDGGEGFKLTDEIKMKLRIANLGKINGPCSLETKQKIRLAQLGKNRHPHSIEQNKLKSIRQLGKIRIPPTIKTIKFKNRANKLSKSYVSPDGEIFYRSEDAALKLKISASTIRRWAQLNINGWTKISREF